MMISWRIPQDKDNGASKDRTEQNHKKNSVGIEDHLRGSKKS